MHPSAQLGSRNVIEAGVTIGQNVIMGDNNWFSSGAKVGTLPEDRKYPLGDNAEPLGVTLGSHNVFREYSVVQSGFKRKTSIGSNNYFQSHTVIGHDCLLANGITLYSNSVVSGYSQLHSLSSVGIGATVHQHTIVGFGAMIGMNTAAKGDVGSFLTINGNPPKIVGPNRLLLNRLEVRKIDWMLFLESDMNRDEIPEHFLHSSLGRHLEEDLSFFSAMLKD